MIRILITSSLLFLLPFFLFAIYATVMDFLSVPKPGESGDAAKKSSAWTNPPVLKLAVVGAILVMGTVVYLAATTGATGPTDGTYHPPTSKDGKIQPGYVD